jgi:hypothetical protein
VPITGGALGTGGTAGTGGVPTADPLAATAFGNCGGAGGSGTLASAACAVDSGSDNVIEDSVASPLAPAGGAMPLSDFQSTGGATCTMLPQRGQFRMLPTNDSSLTLSRARQVVQ